MAGYRRFIAYVYDYESGKKGSNCGFIKVEVKDQQCSVEIHLHCPGLPENVKCNIYGFTRKDGLINGILLDTCETEPLAKSDDYLAAFFMDDYIGGRYSSTSAVGGAVLSLAFGPEVFAQFLDGAAR